MLRAGGGIYELQASVLRTLASPRRLEIVHLLGRGPTEVHQLADELGMSQPNVSAHLAALRSVGLVEPIRDGREVRYQLSDPEIVIACDTVRDVLARRLERLRELVVATRLSEMERQMEPVVAAGNGER